MAMVVTESQVSDESRARECLRPSQSPVMYQRWSELLFLHWRIDVALVAETLPPGLAVDTFDGAAWLGVVPFQMERVRPRFLPALPWLSSFPELNLRTYVVDRRGRPGVWFYSLDTPQPLANWIARTLFHLNYRGARIDVGAGADGGQNFVSTLRRQGNATSEPDQFAWARGGEPFAARPGTLEYFLVERYRLFAFDARRERIRSGRVHHIPYPLERVKRLEWRCDLFEQNGLPAPMREPDSAVASKGVEVTVFPMGD